MSDKVQKDGMNRRGFLGVVVGGGVAGAAVGISGVALAAASGTPAVPHTPPAAELCPFCRVPMTFEALTQLHACPSCKRSVKVTKAETPIGGPTVPLARLQGSYYCATCDLALLRDRDGGNRDVWICVRCQTAIFIPPVMVEAHRAPLPAKYRVETTADYICDDCGTIHTFMQAKDVPLTVPPCAECGQARLVRLDAYPSLHAGYRGGKTEALRARMDREADRLGLSDDWKQAVARATAAVRGDV